MASDLVSDLRNPDVAAGTPAMVMRNQAADEIERLRAALADCFTILPPERVKVLRPKTLATVNQQRLSPYPPGVEKEAEIEQLRKRPPPHRGAAQVSDRELEFPTGLYKVFADDDDVIGLTVARTVPSRFCLVRTDPPHSDSFDDYAVADFLAWCLSNRSALLLLRGSAAPTEEKNDE